MGESALTSHGKGAKHQKLLANLREENRNKHHSLQTTQVVNLLQAQPHQQLPMNHQMHCFDPLPTRCPVHNHSSIICEQHGYIKSQITVGIETSDSTQ